ncbi:hypothetical protein BD779DRAFT_1670034 [Infundibulicybe gibba]|nr:hypothetical protein BD779DRAFT_1670034 [Infundibulicybe gibba]
MSVGKLPWIWAATLGLHISSTAPSPPPPPSKSITIVAKRSILDKLILSDPARFIAKGGYWAIVVAETLVILANRAPHLEISKSILRVFLGNRNPDRLRLSPAFNIGLGLTLVGSLIRVWCYRTMGRFFIFDRRIEDGHKLITSGPYRVVRHPSYSAYIFEIPGMVLLYMSQGSLLKESGLLDTWTGINVTAAWLALKLVTALLLMRTAPLEDAALRGKFGKEWDEWAQRVPYRLIPGVF